MSKNNGRPIYLPLTFQLSCSSLSLSLSPPSGKIHNAVSRLPAAGRLDVNLGGANPSSNFVRGFSWLPPRSLPSFLPSSLLFIRQSDLRKRHRVFPQTVGYWNQFNPGTSQPLPLHAPVSTSLGIWALVKGKFRLTHAPLAMSPSRERESLTPPKQDGNPSDRPAAKLPTTPPDGILFRINH